jgi:NAD(P)-dependent dehydrogenase (short-subunit alcohol dehydrogenase family)
MATKTIAILVGIGPGLGAAAARKFAATYPVVLMARNPDNYKNVVDEINGSGGKALGISADVSSAQSVKNAFGEIEKEFGKDVGCAAAIFNAGGGLVRKPFLELTEQEFSAGFNVNCKGGFHFAQASLPLLLNSVSSDQKYPPTLIFTGATASLRGGPMLSSFAAGKFALRALSQSLAREFGPKGIHVAHAIIDGVIDHPKTKEMKKDAGPDAKLEPESIAETYWYLHTQHRSAMTYEVDLRPFVEKW